MRRNGKRSPKDKPIVLDHRLSSPSPAVEMEKGRVIRLLALAALTLVFIVVSAALAVPFLSALSWAVALGIMTWPMHAWVRGRVRRPNVAAAITTAIVTTIALGAAAFVTYKLGIELTAAAELVTVESGFVGKKLTEAPALEQLAAWLDRLGVDLEHEVRQAAGIVARDAIGLLQGSVAAAVQVLIAVFVLFHIFRDRDVFTRAIQDALPMGRTESGRVFARFADSIHANLYANVVTSLIASVGGGLVFWLVGIRTPMLWAMVMFVLSLLPVVGSGLVWVPVILHLALDNQWGSAAIVLGWGIANSICVDNLLYLRLVGERLRMHQVLALIAFLGGVALFGISGMILGPAIVAVAGALLQVWRDRAAEKEDAMVTQ